MKFDFKYRWLRLALTCAALFLVLNTFALVPPSPPAAQQDQNSTASQSPTTGRTSSGEDEWEKLKLKQDWGGQFQEYDGEMMLIDDQDRQDQLAIEEGKSPDGLNLSRILKIDESSAEVVRTVLLDASHHRRNLLHQLYASNGGKDAVLRAPEGRNLYSQRMTVNLQREIVTEEAIKRLKQQLGPEDFKKLDGYLHEHVIIRASRMK